VGIHKGPLPTAEIESRKVANRASLAPNATEVSVTSVTDKLPNPTVTEVSTTTT